MSNNAPARLPERGGDVSCPPPAPLPHNRWDLLGAGPTDGATPGGAPPTVSVVVLHYRQEADLAQAEAASSIKESLKTVEIELVLGKQLSGRLLANPSLATYAISKGGLNQVTSVAAVALAPHGIRVVGIGPGTILTEMVATAILSSEQARTGVLSRTPIGRCGEPSEIAAVAAFLASDDASYITGQTIYPDGGRLVLNYTVPVRE